MQLHDLRVIGVLFPTLACRSPGLMSRQAGSRRPPRRAWSASSSGWGCPTSTTSEGGSLRGCCPAGRHPQGPQRGRGGRQAQGPGTAGQRPRGRRPTDRVAGSRANTCVLTSRLAADRRPAGQQVGSRAKARRPAGSRRGPEGATLVAHSGTICMACEIAPINITLSIYLAAAGQPQEFAAVPLLAGLQAAFFLCSAVFTVLKCRGLSC